VQGVPETGEGVRTLERLSGHLVRLDSPKLATRVIARAAALAEGVGVLAYEDAVWTLANLQGHIGEHAAARETFSRLISDLPSRRSQKIEVQVGLIGVEVRSNDDRDTLAGYVEKCDALTAATEDPGKMCGVHLGVVGHLLKSAHIAEFVDQLLPYVQRVINDETVNAEERSVAYGFRGALLSARGGSANVALDS
jgi:hypothetical protein